MAGFAPGAASVLAAVYTVAALALAVVALRAWRHAGGGRAGLLATAFVLWFAKGLLFTYGLFTSATWKDELMLPGLAVDVAAFALLYAAILR